MRARSGLVVASALAALLFGCGQPEAVGQPAPPVGYEEVTGSPDVLLNPAHIGAQGSEFSQDCDNAVPPPPPGGVLWHFILPRSVSEFLGGNTPQNLFAELRVTFAAAGPVTLTTFGPPSSAHAWVYTDADDTLTAGNADMFRLIVSNRGNEPFFNLSHTCFVPPTTPTTAAPTTAAPTTAAPTTASPTTAGPTTSISGGGGGSTSTMPSGGGTTTTVDPALPVTGTGRGLAVAALAILAIGALLALLARRPTSG